MVRGTTAGSWSGAGLVRNGAEIENSGKEGRGEEEEEEMEGRMAERNGHPAR